MTENKILLGGPIQHAYDESGRFDSRLKELVLHLAEILKQASYEVLSAHIAEDFGSLLPLSSEELVLRDYGWVQLCDVYLAIFVRDGSGKYIRSDGTHVEIGWASSMGKPIVLVVDDMPSEENSHLVRGLGAIAHVQSVSIAEIEYNPQVLLTCVQKAIETASGNRTG